MPKRITSDSLTPQSEPRSIRPVIAVRQIQPVFLGLAGAVLILALVLFGLRVIMEGLFALGTALFLLSIGLGVRQEYDIAAEDLDHLRERLEAHIAWMARALDVPTLPATVTKVAHPGYRVRTTKAGIEASVHLMERLTPAEIDFLVARELACLRPERSRERSRLMRLRWTAVLVILLTGIIGLGLGGSYAAIAIGCEAFSPLPYLCFSTSASCLD